MFETNRLVVNLAQEEDIDYIVEMENHIDNIDYIWQGTYQEHLKEIEDPSTKLLIIYDKITNDKLGYALMHIDHKSNVLELRRFAITQKGIGYGKEFMAGVFDYAFNIININRIWLDVFTHNDVAIKLYEKMNMTKEGMFRQSYLSTKGYP